MTNKERMEDIGRRWYVTSETSVEDLNVILKEIENDKSLGAGIRRDVLWLINRVRTLTEALEELSHDTDYPWGETLARKALEENEG